jgi:demethylmenaquinone methyltransferase/2-methoxy-6-polyprenyl-1,4-benzoquinol methylase
MQVPDLPANTQALLDRQKEYYEQSADDYERFIQRYIGPYIEKLAGLAIDMLRDVGDVLELAPGPGTFTARLSEVVKVTAYDAAPSMLAKLDALGLPNVETRHQDLFDWWPDGRKRWGGVFMANFLAHVPPSYIPELFANLSRVVRDGGPVCVVDVTRNEASIEREFDEIGGVPIVWRNVDSRTYPIVKQYWRPEDLMSLLHPLGWIGSWVPVGEEDERGFVVYELWNRA